MTAVKTQLGPVDEARSVPFQPTTVIDATDVQEAIEAVEAIASAAAPGDAVYIVGSAHAELSAERVATDTATIDVDLGTAGQAKWNVLEVPGIASTGMVARTAAATYTARTITGTANEITATNGDGVSGDPTLSFPTNIVLTNKNIDEVERLGINTTADSTNRLSVNSDAVLFNHNGTTSQVKVNKNATANTASHLFQVGFSGRAEFGLIASDDFLMKTSPDGSAFTTGLTILNSTAALRVHVNISPSANDGAALGTTALQWSDLFLATGGVINWANGGITITETSDALVFAAATSYQFSGGPIQPTANDGIALGTATVSFADLFLATGAVVNYADGNYTITHSSDNLAFSGSATYAAGKNVVIGHTATIDNQIGGTALTPALEVVGSGLSASAMQAIRYGADSAPSSLVLSKSRNTSVGSHTVVQNSDTLGRLAFTGSDGANFAQAAEIVGFVDGTPGTNDMPGGLSFRTSPDGTETPVEIMRITSAAKVVVAAASAQTGLFSEVPKLQVLGTDGPTSSMLLARYQADGSAPNVTFAKSRNASIGSHTVVQSGDVLGFVSFGGSDGDEFIEGARIQAVVDGTPGNNDMPTRLVLSVTADGASSTTEALRISATGITSFAQRPTGVQESFIIACSDEATNLTTGTNKVKFRMPYAFTVTAVRASLSTAQTAGSIFTVDINESGTTILSTKLTIDNNELTSTTAATPPVISDAALADDAEMSVDIDQVGTAGAKGLKVTIIGYRP